MTSIFPSIKRILKKIFKFKPRPIRRRRRVSRRPRPDKVNKVIISMINKERKKRHLHTVSYDHDLKNHSRQWSRHMARIRRLEHSHKIPENCAMVSARGSPTSIARSCFQVWMKSPPHRAWMMQEQNPKIGGMQVIHYVGFAYHIRGEYAYAALAFK